MSDATTDTGMVLDVNVAGMLLLAGRALGARRTRLHRIAHKMAVAYAPKHWSGTDKRRFATLAVKYGGDLGKAKRCMRRRRRKAYTRARTARLRRR